jgi:hypothetical protein
MVLNGIGGSRSARSRYATPLQRHALCCEGDRAAVRRRVAAAGGNAIDRPAEEALRMADKKTTGGKKSKKSKSK